MKLFQRLRLLFAGVRVELPAETFLSCRDLPKFVERGFEFAAAGRAYGNDGDHPHPLGDPNVALEHGACATGSMAQFDTRRTGTPGWICEAQGGRLGA